MIHPVPDTPPRAILYLRQSTHREESISLEIQETAGRDYAARAGYIVTEVLADPGLSGRTWARPAVQRAQAMIEDGEADVIVVWKWSRLARNRRDWAVAVDTIEAAGGRLESSTETVDTSTSTGRLARGMLAEIAAFESDRIGDGWREVHARRIKAGLPANGKPRWGYTYDRDAKIHRPDPATGPILAQMYARYVAGESVYSLVRWLNANGYRTSPGYSASGDGPWSDRSLRRVLDSGFAAGLITAGDHRSPGAHEPLIDTELWEAYQVSRASRRVRRSSERSVYLLSGLMRCYCGAAMSGGQFGAGGVAKFRCGPGKEQGRHDGGYVTMHLVEAAVLDWLRDVAAELTDAAAQEALTKARTRRHAHDARALEREEAAVHEQLVRATRGHVEGVIPEPAYRQVVTELEERAAMLEARRLAAKVASREASAPTLAADLLADWDVLAVEIRRTGLRRLIHHIVVTPGRPRSTIDIVPAWTR